MNEIEYSIDSIDINTSNSACDGGINPNAGKDLIIIGFGLILIIIFLVILMLLAGKLKRKIKNGG